MSPSIYAAWLAGRIGAHEAAELLLEDGEADTMADAERIVAEWISYLDEEREDQE
jgi:hypothetical protein